MAKTRSIPYWTTNVFSYTVTDFVLIHESVTSSASVVRWLHYTAEHSAAEFSYDCMIELTNDLS
jgi:hypothetical protein